MSSACWCDPNVPKCGFYEYSLALKGYMTLQSHKSSFSNYDVCFLLALKIVIVHLCLACIYCLVIVTMTD